MNLYILFRCYRGNLIVLFLDWLRNWQSWLILRRNFGFTFLLFIGESFIRIDGKFFLLILFIGRQIIFIFIILGFLFFQLLKILPILIKYLFLINFFLRFLFFNFERLLLHIDLLGRLSFINLLIKLLLWFFFCNFI